MKRPGGAANTPGAEARRLGALGVPAVRRYGKGVERSAGAWTPRRIAYIAHSSTYKGELVLNSRHGRITRAVPALVSADVWEAANQQLVRNRSLPTRHDRIPATRSPGHKPSSVSGWPARSAPRSSGAASPASSLKRKASASGS